MYLSKSDAGTGDEVNPHPESTRFRRNQSHRNANYGDRALFTIREHVSAVEQVEDIPRLPNVSSAGFAKQEAHVRHHLANELESLARPSRGRD
jgi:hypothetical protein